MNIKEFLKINYMTNKGIFLLIITTIGTFILGLLPDIFERKKY